jgi:hypothetical protein
MKRQLAVLAASLFLILGTEAAAADWAQVDRTLGRAGTVQPGNVHRYSFLRSDLSVTLDGVGIKPSLALGSWLAFLDMGDRSEVMGDLVLTHAEVNAVLSRLLEGRVRITALHNQMMGEQPRLYFMRFWATATPPG